MCPVQHLKNIYSGIKYSKRPLSHYHGITLAEVDFPGPGEAAHSDVEADLREPVFCLAQPAPAALGLGTADPELDGGKVEAHLVSPSYTGSGSSPGYTLTSML